MLDPESLWRYPVEPVCREDVERRIGAVTEPLEALSGGLCNINVRIGSDRVLRIRTDGARVTKEANLLARPWRSFRTPAVLATGDDFLLLEHVEHVSLDGAAERGAAVGRALAEIHSITYRAAGLLGDDLTVTQPFPGDGVRLAEFLRGYGHEKLAPVAPLLGDELSTRIAQFLEREPLGAAGHAVDTPVLTHGDFKTHNLGWTPSGALLVLDWEWAWAGTRYMDLGHLLRWQPPDAFVRAFAAAYTAEGGILVDNWRRIAEVVDLCGLLGLYGHAVARQTGDVLRRIAETLDSR